MLQLEYRLEYSGFAPEDCNSRPLRRRRSASRKIGNRIPLQKIVIGEINKFNPSKIAADAKAYKAR